MPEADEPQNEVEAKQGQRQIQRKAAPNFASYYVNNSEVGMTTWDVSIRFARIQGIADNVLDVEDQAVVTMSLHHAKALAIILASYIKQYEKDNGKLAVPLGAIGEIGSEEQKIPTSIFEGEKKE